MREKIGENLNGTCGKYVCYKIVQLNLIGMFVLISLLKILHILQYLFIYLFILTNTIFFHY
jgi:hypothetical protein